MPENKVEVILEASLDASKLYKEWDGLIKQFSDKSTDELRKWLDNLEKSIKAVTKSSEKLNLSQVQQVKEMKKYAAVMKDAIKVAEQREKAEAAASKAVSPEQIQETADSWEAQREEVSKYITTVAQAKVEIQKVRDEIRALATSQVADAESTKQSIASKRQYLTVLQSLLGQYRLEEQAVRSIAQEQERQVHKTDKLIKRLLTWGAGVASIYYLYRKLRVAIVENFKEVYGTTEAYKEQAAALDRLGKALIIALVPPSTAESSFERIAKWADRLGTTLLQLSALYQAVSAAGRTTVEEAGGIWEVIGKLPSVKLSAGFASIVAELIGITDSSKPAKAALEALLTTWEKSNELLEQNAENLKEVESATESLISQYRKAVQAQREINAAFDEAEAEYRSGMAVAEGELASTILQINIDLEKQIDEINQDALDARAKAYEDYQYELARTQQQAEKQERNDLERHLLEMEFERRRHQLSQIQNERVYQYERTRLVAEGDVLAIEDLDARYELERQAAEENFALQMEQAEAMFRLQARIQSEAMRDQIRALQDALNKQLQAIEENRREQIAKAQAGAEDEKKEARETYAEQLADLQASYEEAKKARDAAYDEWYKDQAEFLADLAREYGLDVDKLLEKHQKIYGTDGRLVDETIKTYNEIESQTRLWTSVMTNLMSQAGTQAGTMYSRSLMNALNRSYSIPGVNTTTGGRRSQDTGGYKPPSSFQYGGEQIYSQPTNIEVGHGPERVIVQPLTGVAGNFNVHLGGRAVIEGQGQFSGMDMAAVHNTINDALQSAFVTMINSRSGIKGRRGF